MKTCKKVFAIMLILSLIIPSTAVFANGELEGHWAKDTLNVYLNASYLNTYADGTVKPNQAITRGEFVGLINRVFGYYEKAEEGFTDVSANSPVYNDTLIAKRAGYISGYEIDGSFRPDNFITRQEVAAVLSRALKLEEQQFGQAGNFADGYEIADWAMPYMNAVVAKGYYSGYEDATIRPINNITRAEATVMVNRIVGQIVKNTGLKGAVVPGNLTVSGKDLSLSDVVVKGDLILAAGIGESDVTLNNVTVEGTTLVQGGGENSVIFNNTSINDLVIYKVNGKIRVVAKGTTAIQNAHVKSGAKLQEENSTGSGFSNVEIIEVKAGENLILDGDFENIQMDAPVEMKVTETSKVAALNLGEKSKGSSVDVSENAKIGKLNVKAEVKVDAKGTIDTVEVDVLKDAEGKEQKVTFDGNIGKVEVKNSEAKIEIAKTAVIQEINVEKTAGNVQMDFQEGSNVKQLVAEAAVDVKGKGTIDNATIKAAGVNIEQKVTNVVMEKGVEADVAGAKVDKTVVGDKTKLADGMNPVVEEPATTTVDDDRADREYRYDNYEPDPQPQPQPNPNPNPEPDPVYSMNKQDTLTGEGAGKYNFTEDIVITKDGTTLTNYEIVNDQDMIIGSSDASGKTTVPDALSDGKLRIRLEDGTLIPIN